MDGEHAEILSLLGKVIISFKGGSPDAALFSAFDSRLKTHIYTEETSLFPLLDAGKRRERNGLEMEHGAMWKLLAVIKKALSENDLDLALRRSESLERVLKSHYTAEEPLLSGSNTVSGPGKMPDGWVCSVLRKN